MTKGAGVVDTSNAVDGSGPRAPALLETGIPNLDRVLGGGIRRRSTVMVIGAPGTGKTIMAQQLVFHAAGRGAVTLYLTGYSETHAKLLEHNRSLRFFDPERIGREIQFGSLTDLLREGAEATEAAIVSTARTQQATLVVLDGFRSMRGILAHDEEIAHFLYSLGAKLAVLGATTLVLVEGDPDEPGRYPELTVCDAILALRRERQGTRYRRVLDVVKVRGAAYLGGMHPFILDASGLTLYPRFESVVVPLEPAWHGGRAGFGLPEVDALLGGGLTVGTTTLVAGSPGVGKTLLGLHFVAAGVRANEPALFLGFMENTVQLREKARMFGLDLVAAEAAGLARLVVLPGYDLEADRAADLLRREVEQRGVRRVVIDSAADLERGMADDTRKAEFFSALVAYLRGHDVTTYITLDLNTIVGPALEFIGTPLSVLAENLLVMRYTEHRGRLRRLLLVLKMRYSDYDRTVHEYTITAGRGVELLGPAPAGAGLLTGLTQPYADLPSPRPPDEPRT
jgi:circadian clock protein KaiC